MSLIRLLLLVSLLASLAMATDEGVGIDPNGLAASDHGWGLDPNGATTDGGPHMDPNGGRPAIPRASTERIGATAIIGVFF
jgi:hypothetical protein